MDIRKLKTVGGVVAKGQRMQPVALPEFCNKENQPPPLKMVASKPKAKKTNKFRTAAAEIKAIQKASGVPLGRQKPLVRAVKEALGHITKGEFTRVNAHALECVKVALDHFMTELFSKGAEICAVRGRKTLDTKDLDTVTRVSNDYFAGQNHNSRLSQHKYTTASLRS